jgi:lipid II:glycine glycyltransferase (peptidoglycan interpeptide bridge formation enzyme)
MQVIHLQNKDIDYARWDKFISESHNQLTYAYSWYLDIVSPKWEALVSEDYEYIMPLPVKRRYGLPYLVQPVLTQQLGIFSKHTINEKVVRQFIKELPSFSYEINLNEHNFHSDAVAFPNYILDLNKPYEQIASHYSKNTKRNIDKAQKLNLNVRADLNPNDFLSLYNSIDKNYVSAEIFVLKELLEKGQVENALRLYGVYSDDDNIIAALCVMNSANRITYLMPISSQEGKNSSAMFLLVDNIIQHKANKNIVLDFEGSRIEGIARFYKGFGAKDKPYYILKQFRPSFLIRKPNRK